MRGEKSPEIGALVVLSAGVTAGIRGRSSGAKANVLAETA